MRHQVHEVEGPCLRLQSPRQPCPRLETVKTAFQPIDADSDAWIPAGYALDRASVPAGAGAVPAPGRLPHPACYHGFPKRHQDRLRRHWSHPPFQDQHHTVPVDQHVRVYAPEMPGRDALHMHGTLLSLQTRAPQRRTVDELSSSVVTLAAPGTFQWVMVSEVVK